MPVTYNDGCILKETTKGGIIDYEISGLDKDSVHRAVKKILKDYHPAGYGTSFQGVKEGEDGFFQCYGWRATSCD